MVIGLVNIFHWFNEEKLQNPWKGKNVDMGSKLLKKKNDKRKEQKSSTNNQALAWMWIGGGAICP